ncbi:MAG: bifunctional diaminohydroxyphosphoribosylaminopyrimidine deaminase/5-amino-6-(5-phosphoribosylamino)uracil reductase RibD [Pseudomonadota bacterium]
MSQLETDRHFMAAALALGRTGLGRTAPNPSVGCVIVAANGSRVVGLGRTADGGRPHAERQALRMAGKDANGGTAYVTLEPCSHTGKTPPCVEALVHSRISRVVIATLDPNPLVAGEGVAKLTKEGIAVTEGVRAAEAEWDLAGHLTRMRHTRPHVTLKLAVSAEGAIGRRGEGQIAISGPASRQRVQLMRAEADVIAVGVGTVLADDPQLTCRLPGMASRSPQRLIFDRQLRTPLTAALFDDVPAVPVILVHAADAPPSRVAALNHAGAELIQADSLASALAKLGASGTTSVLVEGGGTIADAFLDADLVDRIAHVHTPTRIAPPLVAPRAGRRPGSLSPKFRTVTTERIGEDVWTWLERA